MAAYGPFVPTAPLLALLEPEIARAGIGAVAARAGLSPRRIYRWQVGEVKAARFDQADRVICGALGDPSLWHSVPELAAIFERR